MWNIAGVSGRNDSVCLFLGTAEAPPGSVWVLDHSLISPNA
jgi:hypothetical protein